MVYRRAQVFVAGLFFQQKRNLSGNRTEGVLAGGFSGGF
jgi:hypothetical protein